MRRAIAAGALDRVSGGAGGAPQRSPVAELKHRLEVGTVCFDTTIPLYFASRDLDADLRLAFGDRAVTPWAVVEEVEALVPNLVVGPAAVALLRNKSLPRVIPSDPELAADADRIRAALARMRDETARQRGAAIRATADRGESAALAVCRRYARQPMSILAQDGMAKRMATRYDVPVLGAAHALLAICRAGFLRPDVAWIHYLDMSRRGMAHQEFRPDHIGRALFLAVFAQIEALD
jgi:hypothetical protein